mmetsp:Transcript_43537/g.69634  ORF Transcript_43537/g.69634 Transcript_43537/m.69634 type:complete len:149 (-) Transcript_43537:691-1137(-)
MIQRQRRLVFDLPHVSCDSNLSIRLLAWQARKLATYTRVGGFGVSNHMAQTQNPHYQRLLTLLLRNEHARVCANTVSDRSLTDGCCLSGPSLSRDCQQRASSGRSWLSMWFTTTFRHSCQAIFHSISESTSIELTCKATGLRVARQLV